MRILIGAGWGYLIVLILILVQEPKGKLIPLLEQEYRDVCDQMHFLGRTIKNAAGRRGPRRFAVM